MLLGYPLLYIFLGNDTCWIGGMFLSHSHSQLFFFHQLSFTTVIRAWLEAEVFAHQEPTNPRQAEMGESVPMHMQGNCIQ